MPVNNNLNQRIRQTMYMLKRYYGNGPVSIYQQTSSSVDLDSGVKTVVKDVTVLERVIILPVKMKREVLQSISQISADKSFVYGGFFDSGTRMFIIDRRDARELVMKKDNWLVYRGRRYEIVSIQDFEFDTAYVVIAKEQLGEVPEQIFPRGVDNFLEMTVTATAEK